MRVTPAILSLCVVFSSVQALAAPPKDYADLLAVYETFRRAADAPMSDGLADYGEEAMAERQRTIARLLADVEATDEDDWPLRQRVDLLLVLAEMRGADFHHRILRPWQRDPSFYSTLNLGFGPKIEDAADLPQFPIEDAAALHDFSEHLERVPDILDRARQNLTDLRGDLIRLGIDQKAIERNLYLRFAEQAEQFHPELVPAAQEAAAATARFLAFLNEEKDEVPAAAGVGADAFSWYARYVLLFPYDLQEMLALSEREYQRSLAFLKMEEHQHRDIPMPEPVDSLAAFEALRSEADDELLLFLEEEDILTVPSWLSPPKGEGPYLMPVDRDPAQPDPFTPPIERNFFRETEDRDPRPLRAHNVPGHLLDAGLRQRSQTPIRGDERLYYIDSSRIEGWAFYLEEMLLQTGFMDDRPKAREITYILQVKRAARLAPELNMHSNEWTFGEALASLTGRTPYWMESDDDTAVYDLGLYLRQPGLGINYYFGKLQIEELLADLAAAEGRDFDLRAFHDRFLASGHIPVALIRWEMTGLEDQVKEMRDAPPITASE